MKKPLEKSLQDFRTLGNIDEFERISNRVDCFISMMTSYLIIKSWIKFFNEKNQLYNSIRREAIFCASLGFKLLNKGDYR